MESTSVSTIDWSKCIFCQKDLRLVKTICPANTKRSDSGAGYHSLSKDVNRFKEIGQLPPGLHVSRWDEGDGIEATCTRNKACWHAACRTLLHSTKLDRLLKRPRVPDEAPSDSGSDNFNLRQ